MSRLIGVIDAGTNKIRFVIYKLPNFDELLSHEIRIEQISKNEGWLGKQLDGIVSYSRISGNFMKQSTRRRKY